jgi:hypothetical protein
MRNVNLQRLLDGGIDVVLAGGFREEDVDGEGATWDGETGGVVVEFGELCGRGKRRRERSVGGGEGEGEKGGGKANLGGVHRCGGDDELEVSAARKNCAYVVEDKRERERERKDNALFLNNPMRMSVLSERSCASSRMMTEYRSRSPSLSDSRSMTPSVMSAGR